MIFQFSNFIIDVDVEKTREFYNTAPLITADCSCSGCRNYEKAVDSIPKEIASFFAQLGIDMKKSPDVHVHNPDVDGLVLYGGWYHLCGKLVSGESPWVSTGSGMHLDETKLHAVSEGFRVWFQRGCALLADTFPLPAIQLELYAYIPWVLDEPNEYLSILAPKKHVLRRFWEKISRHQTKRR